MHPALDLLHHGPVHKSVRIPELRPTVHWVLLLGPVEELGADYDVPHYGEGTARDLPAWRGSSCHRPACHNPAVQSPTSSSLRAISAARPRGGGTRGGTSGRKSLRDSRGGKRQRWEEREQNRSATRRVGDRDEEDGRKKKDDGRTVLQRTGPGKSPQSGKHLQSRGGVPREGGGPGGERRQER